MLTRFLAVWLSISLILPSPAFALRALQSRQDPNTIQAIATGLEEGGAAVLEFPRTVGQAAAAIKLHKAASADLRHGRGRFLFLAGEALAALKSTPAYRGSFKEEVDALRRDLRDIREMRSTKKDAWHRGGEKVNFYHAMADQAQREVLRGEIGGFRKNLLAFQRKWRNILQTGLEERELQIGLSVQQRLEAAVKATALDGRVRYFALLGRAGQVRSALQLPTRAAPEETARDIFPLDKLIRRFKGEPGLYLVGDFQTYPADPLPKVAVRQSSGMSTGSLWMELLTGRWFFKRLSRAFPPEDEAGPSPAALRDWRDTVQLYREALDSRVVAQPVRLFGAFVKGEPIVRAFRSAGKTIPPGVRYAFMYGGNVSKGEPFRIRQRYFMQDLIRAGVLEELSMRIPISQVLDYWIGGHPVSSARHVFDHAEQQRLRSLLVAGGRETLDLIRDWSKHSNDKINRSGEEVGLSLGDVVWDIARAHYQDPLLLKQALETVQVIPYNEVTKNGLLATARDIRQVLEKLSDSGLEEGGGNGNWRDYFNEFPGQQAGGPTVLFLFPPGQKVINAYRKLAGRVVVLKDEHEPSGSLGVERLRRFIREINPHYLSTFVNDRVDEVMLSEEVTPNLKGNGLTHMGLGTGNINQGAHKMAAMRDMQISSVGGGDNVLKGTTAEMAVALAMAAWFGLNKRLEPVTASTDPERVLGHFLRGYLPAPWSESYLRNWDDAADLIWAIWFYLARRIEEGQQLAMDDRFRGAGNGLYRAVEGHQLTGDPRRGMNTRLGVIGPEPMLRRWLRLAKAHRIYQVFYGGERKLHLEKEFNAHQSKLVHVGSFGSYDRVALHSDYVLLSPDYRGAISRRVRRHLDQKRGYPWLVDPDELALKEGLPHSEFGALLMPFREQRVGFVGLGSIGSTALGFQSGFVPDHRGHGFFLGVKHSTDKEAYYEDLANRFGIQYADLATVFKKSDIVMLALPETEETIGLATSDNVEEWMRGRVIGDLLIVNVGRGTALAKTKEDEERWVKFLRRTPQVRLAMDVLPNEMRPRAEQPFLAADLLESGQVTVTAHISSKVKAPRGRSVRDLMGRVMFRNFKAMVEGKPLLNPVPLPAGLEETQLSEAMDRFAEVAKGHDGVLVITRSGLEEHPWLLQLARHSVFAGRMVVYNAALTIAQLALLREYGVRVIEENDFDALVITLLAMNKADRVAVLEQAGALTQALTKVLPPSIRVVSIAIGAQIKAILSFFVPEELGEFDSEVLGTVARLLAA